MKVAWAILWLWPPLAWSAEIIQCDPADPVVPNRAIRHDRSANTQPAWLTDPTYIVNPVELPSGSDRYWKCAGGSVVAMTMAEQTDLDASMVAAKAKADAFQSEVTTNDLCAAELSDLDTRIDLAVSTITDLASAKTVLRMALKKIARCLRARAG